nr:zinc finger and BTB domain-containing protein 41-like isoform X1 [Cherax quadricarinatus]
MASDEKILEEVGESSHDTPQAITITIMDPSALETAPLDSSLVTSVQTHDTSHGTSTLLMVPGGGQTSISVKHSAKDIIQTVTETHMGPRELPVISNISNPDEETSEESTIHVTKTNEFVDEREGEGVGDEDGEEADEPVEQHCLICNIALPSDQSKESVPVFKTQTTTTHRKISVFLGTLIGQKLTSRKAHSDIMCQQCFCLLDTVDALEVEIHDTKEEIVNKYQETVAVYGGRARRRKPAAAKKTDYVFPKVEPEDEDAQILGLEMDENFEPRVEDLMEEENDHREDRSTQDEEWEPELKRPRIKKESVDTGSSGPPKRKRGRPRKDASKPKELDAGDYIAETEGSRDEAAQENRLGRSGTMKTKTCIYCEKEVPIIQLISHLDGHEQQQHPCPFCQHSFSRLALSRHLQERHPGCFMSCDVCSYKFIDSHVFNIHQVSHKTGEYSCNDCGIKFGTADELSNHRKLVHIIKNDEKYSCPVCAKTYELRSKFITHIVKLHKGQVPVDGLIWGSRGSLVCCTCKKKFKKASLFLAHEKTHWNNRLICQHCKNTYPSLTLLQDHVLTHYFGDYVCNECCIKFTSLHQLNMHGKKVHRVKVSNVCEYCNKEFSEQVYLICHRRKEHPESEECRKAKFSCSECGMKFMVRGNLSKHLRMHDREKVAKPCACDVCGKVLSNKYSLASHQKTHSRDTSYKCKVCDKAFVSKYTLVDHVRRIHEEVGCGRDKVCKECGRTFFTNSELKYHIKTHTGERPYRCDICGETYLSSSSLRYHMQKHSNVMFVCQDCQAKFKNYVGWSAHMKRVHGVSCVKGYTKEHGILKAVIEKENPSLYIVAQGHNRAVEAENKASKEILIKDNLSSAEAVDLEETVSIPKKDSSNIIHVSYDDLANPLVHTVDAKEVGLGNSQIKEAQSSNSALPGTSGVEANCIDSVTESNYSQTIVKTKVMVPEGWEVILATECQESQDVSEEWEGPRMAVSQVPQTSEDQPMVLRNEWDGAQGMAQLVISEEGEETRIVMTSWKDCVEF